MKKIKFSTGFIIVFIVITACFVIFNDEITTTSKPYWAYSAGYHYIAQDESYDILSTLLFVGVPSIIVTIGIWAYNHFIALK